MSINVGGKKVTQVWYGGKRIKEVWYGGKRVFSTGFPIGTKIKESVYPITGGPNLVLNAPDDGGLWRLEFDMATLHPEQKDYPLRLHIGGKKYQLYPGTYLEGRFGRMGTIEYRYVGLAKVIFTKSGD